jgi:amidophosphoribosyltransferase
MKKNTKIQKKKLKNFSPKLKEECGVFGISNIREASTLTALGLHALQHRGQEGCGIVTFDGSKYHLEKRFGLVGDNFNKEKVLIDTAQQEKIHLETSNPSLLILTQVVLVFHIMGI